MHLNHMRNDSDAQPARTVLLQLWLARATCSVKCAQHQVEPLEGLETANLAITVLATLVTVVEPSYSHKDASSFFTRAHQVVRMYYAPLHQGCITSRSISSGA